MTVHYHLENIRTLLSQGFSDHELRCLCHDLPEFRAIYNRLEPETETKQIVEWLVDQARHKVQAERLLRWAREHNPSYYEIYKPYIVEFPVIPGQIVRAFVDRKFWLSAANLVVLLVSVSTFLILRGSLLGPFIPRVAGPLSFSPTFAIKPTAVTKVVTETATSTPHPTVLPGLTLVPIDTQTVTPTSQAFTLTATATHTPISEQVLSQPAATTTSTIAPTSRSTSTPTPTSFARNIGVTLLEPDDGARFNGPLTGTTLRWSAVEPPLGANEYYVVHIVHRSGDDFTWLKRPQFSPDEKKWLADFGPQLTWRVVVAARRTGEANENPQGAERTPYSESRLIHWERPGSSGDNDGGDPLPTEPLPDL